MKIKTIIDSERGCVTHLVADNDPYTLEVVGASHLSGSIGPTGPQGPSGWYLTFTQNAVSNTWTITHALGYYPSITTTDSANTVIEGTISYPSLTSVVVTFSIATSGFAYLS